MCDIHKSVFKSCSIYKRYSYNERYYKLSLTGDTTDLCFLQINFKKISKFFIGKKNYYLKDIKICPKLKKSHSIFIGEKIHHLEVIIIPVKAPASVYRSWQIDYRTLYRSINVKK